jgi:hypothetical protein
MLHKKKIGLTKVVKPISTASDCERISRSIQLFRQE